MNFYRCCIEVDGWGVVYFEDIEYIWAHDEAEAKAEYLRMTGFRKNKKGLSIQAVPYRRVKRVKKTINEVVTQKQTPYLGGYDYKVNKDVTHYYCGHCGKEVGNSRYCTCCDSELVDKR